MYCTRLLYSAVAQTTELLDKFMDKLHLYSCSYSAKRVLYIQDIDAAATVPWFSLHTSSLREVKLLSGCDGRGSKYS